VLWEEEVVEGGEDLYKKHHSYFPTHQPQNIAEYHIPEFLQNKEGDYYLYLQQLLIVSDRLPGHKIYQLGNKKYFEEVLSH
jgi:hypothetical protein